ncbi:MAG: tetratricopeptide repeat protein [Verrucomicrobia bacterium]|nr:tetratricopeptide repeat protein [Verrucomicrobiota bacterium]
MKTYRTKSAAWTLTGLLLTISVAAQAAYVILSDDRKIEGTEIRMTADGSVVLTMTRGPITFTKGQFKSAMADKPAEWDKVVQLVQGKKYDDAITQLNDLARRYRGLGWDVQSISLLARVQVMKGDPAAAITAYETLFRNNPGSKDNPDVAWPFRQALLDAKQFDRLNTDLTEVIAKGSRTDAAKAQVMRGDVKMAQNQAEGAVMDYLRTVVFFGSEQAVQPEALFKAAEALEKLRDPRAKEMFKKLVQEYPNAPQAQQARSRI